MLTGTRTPSGIVRDTLYFVDFNFILYRKTQIRWRSLDPKGFAWIYQNWRLWLMIWRYYWVHRMNDFSFTGNKNAMYGTSNAIWSWTHWVVLINRLSYTNLVTTSHFRVVNTAVNHPWPLNQTVNHNKNIKCFLEIAVIPHLNSSALSFKYWTWIEPRFENFR